MLNVQNVEILARVLHRKINICSFLPRYVQKMKMTSRLGVKGSRYGKINFVFVIFQENMLCVQNFDSLRLVDHWKLGAGYILPIYVEIR